MDPLEELIRTSKLILKGDMGVQRVYKGSDLIYKREASYFYVRLDTSTETNNQ